MGGWNVKRQPKKSESKKTPAKSAKPTKSSRPAEPRHSLVVSVKDDHLDQIDEIAKKLEKEGYQIEHVMKMTGGIALQGSGDPEENSERIKKISGVDAVERSVGYQIKPPESEIQ